MAHGQINPEDMPEELRSLIPDNVLASLPDIFEQALGDLSEEHRNTLIEIQSNATSPQDVREGLDDNPDLAAALGRSIAGSLDRPSEFQDDIARAHEAIQRYDLTGDLYFINEAIDAYERISRHSNFASYGGEGGLSVLANSSACYLRRYAATGVDEDLSESLRLIREVVDRTPEDSPRLPGRLNNLGSIYISRYERLGKLEDLNNGIDNSRLSVEKTPENNPFYGRYANNLGNAYRTLYNLRGDLTALDRALEAYLRSVGKIPEGHPERPNRVHNLGTGWRDRFERVGIFDDLEEANRLFQEAVDEAPPGSPGRHLYLRSLAGVYMTSFRYTHDLADLDTAVYRFREAFAEAHPGSPERPGHRAGLGGALVTRFATNGNVQDLDEAIEILEQAVAETPATSPHLSYSLHGLGRGFAARYDHDGDSEDLERADDLFEQVCQKSLSQNVEVEEGLRCARHWGIWASERGAWNEAVRAYDYADRMMERLVRTQIFRRGQELWLREAQGIPGRHAYALARTGDLPGAAVVLERGRARLLGETVGRNHADLESLKESNRSDLYDRYEAAVGQWNAASRAASEPPPSSVEAASAYEAYLVEATKIARTELNAAIEAIRSVPGFELFLRLPTFDEIRTAAIAAPVVYLAATPEGSLALIVADGDVEAVWSDFTNADLRNLFTRTGDDEDEHYPAYRRVIGGYLLGQLGDTDLLDEELERMLPMLGEALMGSVAERLRSKSTGEVILIPAGLLSLFPLHAARYFRQGETTLLLDEFDIAYAPNIRALSIARRQSGRITDCRLAGVGNPMPSHDPLKAAEAELAEVVDLFPEGASQPLYAEAATKSALLTVISEGTYLHFACHGGFDPDAVLNSGLLMAAGERLTLGEILYGAVEVSGVRLVALSACQSGISDFSGLPDENTGFPTALMQAGVPGVVGTLWSVNDFSTALLMVKFYDLHLHGDEENRGVPMSPAQALGQAQRWLKDLTLNEADEMLHSHPHLEEALLRTLQNAPHQTALRGLRDGAKGGGDRPFSAPSYWAPFVFVGA